MIKKKKPTPTKKADPATSKKKVAKKSTPAKKQSVAKKSTPQKQGATPKKQTAKKSSPATAKPVKSTRKRASAAIPGDKSQSKKKGKKEEAPAKKSVRKRAGAKKTATAKTKAEKKKPELLPETLKTISRKPKHTPMIFKLPTQKVTPAVFSLEDVREVIKTHQKGSKTKVPSKANVKKKAQPKTEAMLAQELEEVEHRVLSAASVVDILGFNPKTENNPKKTEQSKIPRKFLKFYKKLLLLRDHVQSGLDLHTQETLKRSSKEDSGELSSYDQHLADAGTDSFDRDFALSLVSNEQEALYEIEEAIKRILAGTYGVCEITGEPISRERLEVVPFTRFSLEGQKQFESNVRKQLPRYSAFIEGNTEERIPFRDEDAED